MNKQQVHAIHDSGYKKLFSNKEIFRQLLETFVPEPWVKEIDFAQCETIEKSFVSDHYKETESDIIYKAKLKGLETYLVILLEFQSTVDRFMALRVLNYLTNFYMDYVQSNRGVRLLPPLFPIVLYNGDRRWTAPVQFAELLQEPRLLGKYVPHFTYFKIAEHEYSKEHLLQIRNIVSTLFLTESYYDIELVKQEFVGLFQQEEDRQAVSLLVNWLRQLAEYQRITPADYQEVEQVYHTVEEVRSMLVTALEREREHVREEGRKEGRKEGELIGEIRRTQQILKQPVSTTKELAQKNLNDLKQMLQQLEIDAAEKGIDKGELIGEIRATQRFLKQQVMPVEELAQKQMQELKGLLQKLDIELATFN